MMRPRLAPRAVWIATSLLLSSARARSRLATFVHAIPSTNNAAATSVHRSVISSDEKKIWVKGRACMVRVSAPGSQ